MMSGPAWIYNEHALAGAAALPVLEDLRRDVAGPERDALTHAWMCVMRDVRDCRRMVAQDCAPWFDGSAFYSCSVCAEPWRYCVNPLCPRSEE